MPSILVSGVSEMTEIEESDALSSPAQVALDWFRQEFVEKFAQGDVPTKTLCRHVEQDDKFFRHLFHLLDSDETGTLSFEEYVGGLFKLGRGRDVPNEKISYLTQFFLIEADEKRQLDPKQFLHMCKRPKFSEGLFSLFDIDDSGTIHSAEFTMSLDKLARSSSDTKWCLWTEKWFSRNANKDGEITKAKFIDCFSTTKSFFSERLFAVVDTNNSGAVDVTELMEAINTLTRGSASQRLLLLFRIYDTDGNNRLSPSEIKTALQWCLSDSAMEHKHDLVEKLTSVLFKHLDKNADGEITLSEFEEFLKKYPSIAENLSIRFSLCMRPNQKKKIISNATIKKKKNRAVSWMKNNKPLVGFWFIYLAVNVTLFVTAASNYWTNDNIFVVLARGCGQCLNFNPAFIVVLMYRHILTYLRSTWLKNYLPLDHSIDAHKFIGVAIVFYSAFHTAMHMANLESLSHQGNTTWAQYLFTPLPGVEGLAGYATITGWILVIILLVIAITSHPFVRRRGHFQVFYWTHWLFVVWWIVLLLHGPRFRYWLVGPATIYILEKVWSLFTWGKTRGTVVRSIRSVDSKVSEVILERPSGFKFQAGDYVFIRIPEIAKFEWHPFTVSSAPEQSDYISLHIQAVGDWTKGLRELGNNWSGRFTFSSVLPFASAAKTPSNRKSNYFDNLAFVDETAKTVMRNPSKMTIKGKEVVLPETEKGSGQVSLMMVRPYMPLESFTKSGENREDESNARASRNPLKKIKVQIDGPYGSPSTTVYDVDHAILIAAGIGVTPFASILQSMMARRKRQLAVCPQCDHKFKLTECSGIINVPKKVEFIWVTRTFNALEWFLGVLGELEEQQEMFGDGDKFLELNLNVTSALRQSDIRAVVLQTALELCYQEESRDPLCGLRTRIQPGRPNWRKIFGKIVERNERKTCVFYCGPPQLESILKKLCLEFNLDFRAENF